MTKAPTHYIYVGGGAGGGVAGGAINLQTKKNTFWVPKNTFMDVFDITCDISDFRAHIFCPQTTQELPKKHHKAGPPKQALTTAYGCIVTMKIGERIACAN